MYGTILNLLDLYLMKTYTHLIYHYFFYADKKIRMVTYLHFEHNHHGASCPLLE